MINGIITEIDYSQKSISEKIEDLEKANMHFRIPYIIQIKGKKEIIVIDRKNNEKRVMSIENFASEILDINQIKENVMERD